MPLLSASLCRRLVLAVALAWPAVALAGALDRPVIVAQGAAGGSEGPVSEPRSRTRETPAPETTPRETTPRDTSPRIDIPRVVVPGVNSPRLDPPRSDTPARVEPRDPPRSGETRHGALAAGWTNRMWYSAVWNRGTGPQAETAALEGCENRAPSRSSSSRCRILYAFTTCAALAWTRSGAGFGAAVRETREAAAEAALLQCQSHNRRRSCQVAGAWCAND